jgi:hypothetical protein
VFRRRSDREVVGARCIAFADCYFKFNTADVVAPKIEGGAIDDVLAVVVSLIEPSPVGRHGGLNSALSANEVGVWVAFSGDCVVEAEVISLKEVDRAVCMLSREFPEFEGVTSGFIDSPVSKTPDGFVNSLNVTVTFTLKGFRNLGANRLGLRKSNSEESNNNEKYCLHDG